jgi:hypothetical protein
MRNYSTKQIFTVFAVTLCILVLALAGSAAAKSVYLSADHHTGQFDAWSIEADGTVTKQATYNLQYATDPAGIAIDVMTGWDPVTEEKNDPLMFVSTEGVGGIEVINPVTLQLHGVAPGPVNMGGVDVDDENNILFAIQRGTSAWGGSGTSNLYIYTYNNDGTGIAQLANITLPNHGYGMSLAFDDLRDVLWVGDIQFKMVRAYDVNVSDWNNIAEIPSLSFSVSHPPIDIAVDMNRNIVYTVAGWAGSNLITKYDVATSTENTVNIGHGGMGVAVDEITGYVYITGGGSSGATSGDNLEVWDCSTSPFTRLQATPDIGNPAGLAIANVSYNPLNLAKNDNIQAAGVSIGSKFTYNITFDSPSSDLTGVIITDTLPVELDFVSANESGMYDSATHTVIWDIGAISAGDTIATFTLEVQVNSNATPGSTIHNYCTLDGDQIPPTTVIEGEGDEEPGTPVLTNIPPDVSEADPSLACLWPPDHKFVEIGIMGVTDPDGDPVTMSIVAITSDEPTAADEGSGGAKHSPDASGVGTDTASVRAERSGNGDGRVYVIEFTASDGRGGESEGSVMVKVPHDQSSEDCPAIDSGQNYDATEIN